MDLPAELADTLEAALAATAEQTHPAAEEFRAHVAPLIDAHRGRRTLEPDDEATHVAWLRAFLARPKPVAIHAIPPELVAPPLRAAGRHALLAAARDLGPEAMPPDGRIHWWVREPIPGSSPAFIGNPDPEYIKVVERADGKRSQHRYGGFTTDDGDIWVAVDHPFARPIAETVAHEAYHRHRQVNGIEHVDADASEYASAYMSRYWWVDGVPIEAAAGRVNVVPPDPTD